MCSTWLAARGISRHCARRGCVVSALTSRITSSPGPRRAAAEGLRIDFQEGDAEALPFADGEFDLVVSKFGVMFAPRPDVAAAELQRVTKRGGQIALANWTPEGSSGKCSTFSKRTCRHRRRRPVAAGLGDEATVRSRLRHGFAVLRLTRCIALMHYPFPLAETVEFFRQYYGPTRRAFASLDPPLKRRCVETWLNFKPRTTLLKP